MLVSDILKMDISARDIIQITGLKITKRAISKARRNLGDSRVRVGYDDKIVLSTDQLIQLEKALQRKATHLEAQRVDTLFEQTIKQYNTVLAKEMNALRQYQQARGVYLKERKKYTELEEMLASVKLVAPASEVEEATRALLAYSDTVHAKRCEAANCYQQFVLSSTDTIDLRRKLNGNRKLPSELKNADKDIVKLRKTVPKMEITNVEPSHIETITQTVQNSDC